MQLALRSSFTLSSFALLLASGAARAENLSCQVLPDLFRAYLVNHYSVRSMNDTVKTHTIDQYIKALDPSKTMLLESDVAGLRKSLPGIFDSMRSGDCAKLTEAQKVLETRAQEALEFVKKVLGDGYKLDETVELVTDTEKRGYPKTQAEREELLRKFIHFQISNYLMSDMKLPEARKSLIHRYELIAKRVKERKFDDLLNTFANSFSEALDPHSSYMSNDQMEEFRIDMSLSLEGIGASLSSQDGYTVVEEIIAGGAADRANVLRPKDKIIAVGQEGKPPVSTIDMELKEVVKMIRGKKGTKVALTLLRQGPKAMERVEATITRDKINMKEQAAKLNMETRKVGGKDLKLAVIDLPSFYGEGEKGGRSSFTDVKKLLIEAKQKNADGVVLNLSHNGGGLLEDAKKMGGLFIRTGGIVATQSSRKRVEILDDDDDAIVWSGPLVILTSRGSASASEILSGAMKDYKRAVIVGGDHTFGKGTVQAVVPLPRDLGAMKITTGMFFIPGGSTTQHQGVPGDIALPSPLSNDDFGEKALDYSLTPEKITPFLSETANAEKVDARWRAVSADEIQTLAKKSADRVNKDAKFAEIRKDIEEAKKNKGIVRLAEVLKKSKENKKKDKADEKKTNAQRIKEAQAPYVNEALNVLTDLIEIEKSAKPAGVASAK